MSAEVSSVTLSSGYTGTVASFIPYRVTITFTHYKSCSCCFHTTPLWELKSWVHAQFEVIPSRTQGLQFRSVTPCHPLKQCHPIGFLYKMLGLLVYSFFSAYLNRLNKQPTVKESRISAVHQTLTKVCSSLECGIKAVIQL